MLLVEYGQHVFFVHEQDGVLGAALPELVAGPGGEQDPVPFFDLKRPAGAVLEELAGSDRQDGAALRLLLGAVRDDDAAGRLFSRLRPADDDAISQGL